MVGIGTASYSDTHLLRDIIELMKNLCLFLKLKFHKARGVYSNGPELQ